MPRMSRLKVSIMRSARPLLAIAGTLLISLQLMAGVTATAQEASATPSTESGPRFIIRPVDGADGDYFTLTADAGTKNELKVLLGNADDEDLKLRTYVNDAVPMTNGGFPNAEVDAAPTTTATWVDHPAGTLTFQRGEGGEPSFNVTVPADAKPGQYIAGLALQTADPISVAGTSMFNQVIRKTIAVFIIVPGPETPSFALGEAKPITDGSVPRIEIPVMNRGNVLVKPAGELTLTDSSGQTVMTAPIAMGSVYAGTTAPLSVGLTTTLPDGDYTLNVTLTDAATSVTGSIAHAAIPFSSATAVPAPVSMTAGIALSPDAANPAFATVKVTIQNQGPPIGKAELLLDVRNDGVLVETFPLAASLALPAGTTEVSQRYIPPTGWETGEWTFALRLNVIDESTNAATNVATFDTIPAIEIGK